jgi:hypothetical protein
MEMKHFKDAQGNVYGFAANGSQDHLKPQGLTEISLAEAQRLGKLKYEREREKEIAGMDYVRQRVSSYPEMGEFVDAWVKNDQAALEEYRKKCLAVKAKFPKPQGF